MKKQFFSPGLILLTALLLSGCVQVLPTTTPESTAWLSTETSTSLSTTTPAPTPDISSYAFPGSIDPAKKYLFYLHGKIIEDQGVPAFSPDFGEYEYAAILEKLSSYGFVVISEQRPKDTDESEYALKVAGQVNALTQAGVPANSITVVGASKGGGIAIEVSHLLENEAINFVIIAICHPDEVAYLIHKDIFLFGKVLSIYDFGDEFSGSCEELFAFSEGKGLARHEEIVLHLGLGHGILFQPLDEWLLPAVQWSN
jgi:hypothetical protein